METIEEKNSWEISCYTSRRRKNKRKNKRAPKVLWYVDISEKIVSFRADSWSLRTRRQHKEGEDWRKPIVFFMSLYFCFYETNAICSKGLSKHLCYLKKKKLFKVSLRSFLERIQDCLTRGNSKSLNKMRLQHDSGKFWFISKKKYFFYFLKFSVEFRWEILIADRCTTKKTNEYRF